MAEKTSFIGTGRRKNSIARVRLMPNGKGNFVINKINIEEYALNGILKADTVDAGREKVTRARIEYLQKLLRGI